MTETVTHVVGLRELQRSLAAMDKGIRKDLRDTLKAAVEPVRSDAQRLATANIRHIGPRWSLMRVGVTSSLVYLAPKQRRRGGSPRPNLAQLLMNRAMQPALDESENEIVAAVEIGLDRFITEHGF
jgi:hypothetical protein